MGNPGWVLLSHDENNQPVAMFLDKHSTILLPIVMDERAFSDTVFRATQLSPFVYHIQDIRYWNGKFVYETMNFEAREKLVEDILETFHSPDLTALVSGKNVPVGTCVRGVETYDSQPGTMGVFLPAVE